MDDLSKTVALAKQVLQLLRSATNLFVTFTREQYKGRPHWNFWALTKQLLRKMHANTKELLIAGVANFGLSAIGLSVFQSMLNVVKSVVKVRNVRTQY